MCRLFYFSRPAIQGPTPPLYHTTKVLACQAFQMLNFCYKCVTEMLRYIIFSLHKCCTPVTRRCLIPQWGQVIARVSWKLGLACSLYHKLRAGKAGSHELERAGQLDTVYKLELASWKLRRRAGKSTTRKLDGITIPAATSWNIAHQKSYCGKLEHSNIR